MSIKEKLIIRIKSKPKDFTYNELKTLLISLRFKLHNKGKTSGSRVKFFKSNIPVILHKPHPKNELPEYQINQILEILEKERLI